MTLRITTLIKMTLSIMVRNIVTLSIMAFSVMTLSIMALSVMTRSIMKHYETKHSNTWKVTCSITKPKVMMLSIFTSA
jgi:hypothetical protein